MPVHPLRRHASAWRWMAAVVSCSGLGTRVCAEVETPPKPPAGYHLVWADEFNKDGAPDPANWTYEHGFVRNHELQFYRPENAIVKDGMLVIEARHEKVPNPLYKKDSTDWRRAGKHAEYTSASILTRGHQQWQYGRFEMRARIDTRSGLWPAWWTLGVSGQWPSNGEIDIMEYYRRMLLANVACGTSKRFTAKWDSTRTPLEELGGDAWSREFHVWRMDWDADAIRLYVDDRLLNETLIQDALNADGTSPFHQPHYMILNLALGGDNGGDLGDTQFPARYQIDWVRVYQRTDSAK